MQGPRCFESMRATEESIGRAALRTLLVIAAVTVLGFLFAKPDDEGEPARPLAAAHAPDASR